MFIRCTTVYSRVLPFAFLRCIGEYTNGKGRNGVQVHRLDKAHLVSGMVEDSKRFQVHFLPSVIYKRDSHCTRALCQRGQIWSTSINFQVQGIVEVVPWPLLPASEKYNPNDKVYRIAHSLAQNDCSLRATTEYVAIVDVDELILPRYNKS